MGTAHPTAPDSRFRGNDTREMAGIVLTNLLELNSPNEDSGHERRRYPGPRSLGSGGTTGAGWGDSGFRPRSRTERRGDGHQPAPLGGAEPGGDQASRCGGLRGGRDSRRLRHPGAGGDEGHRAGGLRHQHRGQHGLRRAALGDGGGGAAGLHPRHPVDGCLHSGPAGLSTSKSPPGWPASWRGGCSATARGRSC